MPKPDYYQTLEISPQARDEVITSAYKTLARIYQGSSKPGDVKILPLIEEAKDTLLDPKKREAYDKDRTSLEGRIVGDFKITKEISKGDFGVTYQGEHVLTGLPVCIKHGSLVVPQYVKALTDEVIALWDLRHSSLPIIRQFTKLEDGSPVLILSYIEGPNLEYVVKKIEALDPEHVCWIAERVLSALRYMSFKSTIHGDVHPRNIIIKPDTHEVTLVNFGLSAIRESPAIREKGYTPDYASPEQIAGKPIVPESDLYGLGMSMIYALGGDVKTKTVPDTVPDSICEFIKKLIVIDPLLRASWDRDDLCQEISDLRENEFGKRGTGLMPIDGLERGDKK